jgi:hypothetical protein
LVKERLNMVSAGRPSNMEPLETAERDAAKALEAPLAKHAALTLSAFNLLGEALVMGDVVAFVN